MVAKIHPQSDNVNARGNVEVKLDNLGTTLELPVTNAAGAVDSPIAVTNDNGAITADYIYNSETDGAVTVNSVAGRVLLGTADANVVVTNDKVGVGALVFLSKITNDATAVDFKVEVNAEGGEFTITPAAVSTGDVGINFLVININDLTPA